MNTTYRRAFLGLLLLSALPTPVEAGTGWIALFSSDREPVLHQLSVPVWDREEGIVIAGPSDDQLTALRAKGVAPLFSAPDNGEGIQVLSYDRFFTLPLVHGFPR